MSAVVKELVELMNGTIDIESEKGKGSVFSFTVRLKAKEKSNGFLSEQFKEEGSYFSFRRLKKETVFPISTEEEYEIDLIKKFGTFENMKEIQTILEKLIICIEMENWEKAEQFAGQIKSLIAIEETELRRDVFRLELMIRKEQIEKALEQYENLKKNLKNYFKEGWESEG